tara:strand:- start:385 stop:882 length:498 start_codon:yes stop_codon:yes gene_type:complete
MKKLEFKKSILIFIVSFLLFSCGYELRTHSKFLNNQTINFAADFSVLNELLELELLSVNDNLITKNSDAVILLKILNHSLEEFVGSTGYGARTTQVRLDYKLEYEIIKNKKDKTTFVYEDSTFVDFNQSDLLSFKDEIDIARQMFISKGVRNIEFILSNETNETE